MAQNVFSLDAWTRARNRFVEDLTDEEQVCTCQNGLQHFILPLMGNLCPRDLIFRLLAFKSQVLDHVHKVQVCYFPKAWSLTRTALEP